jgi:hypothetical protein
MSKIDQYRRGMELCMANAVRAPFAELRAVWHTLGSTYAVLAELESWTHPPSTLSPQLGLDAPQLTDPRIDDRIRP